jgi:hypothetical protein
LQLKKLWKIENKKDKRKQTKQRKKGTLAEGKHTHALTEQQRSRLRLPRVIAFYDHSRFLPFAILPFRVGAFSPLRHTEMIIQYLMHVIYL